MSILNFEKADLRMEEALCAHRTPGTVWHACTVWRVRSELMILYFVPAILLSRFIMWMGHEMIFITLRPKRSRSTNQQRQRQYRNKSDFSIPWISIRILLECIHKRVNACNLVWILIVTNHIIIIIFGHKSHRE